MRKFRIGILFLIGFSWAFGESTLLAKADGLWCRNLYEYACQSVWQEYGKGEFPTSRTPSNLAYVKEASHSLMRQVTRRWMKKAIARMQLQLTMGGSHPPGYIQWQDLDFFKRLKEYNARDYTVFLDKQYLKTLEGFGGEEYLKSLFEYTRSTLSEVIEESSLRREDKNQILQNLKSIKLTAPVDYIYLLVKHFKAKYPKSKENFMAKVIKNYTHLCGEFGEVSNAAYMSLTHSFTLCSGLVWQLFDDSNGDQKAFEISLMRVIAHEMMHSSDFKKAPLRYQEQAECYHKRFKREFNSKIPLWHTKEETELKMGEISSDYWAAKVLAKVMTKWKGSAEENADLLAASVRFGCYSKDSGGVHPSGEFRANVILEGDTELRELLGCESRWYKRACEL